MTPAPGERALRTLLAGMRPVLDPASYVFATLEEAEVRRHAALPVLMRFVEDEGVTLILERSHAEAAGLAAHFACRRITLTVQSSLEAVGFIAAVATRLAAAGMGVNPVSGFHHDHLFVPDDRADEAMAILLALAADAQADMAAQPR